MDNTSASNVRPQESHGHKTKGMRNRLSMEQPVFKPSKHESENSSEYMDDFDMHQNEDKVAKGIQKRKGMHRQNQFSLDTQFQMN